MWRYLSVERNNKQTCVKLFAENSNSPKNGPSAPIASFVTKLLISLPPNQQTIVHPGKFLLLLGMYRKMGALFLIPPLLIFGMYRKWGYVWILSLYVSHHENERKSAVYLIWLQECMQNLSSKDQAIQNVIFLNIWMTSDSARFEIGSYCYFQLSSSF